MESKSIENMDDGVLWRSINYLIFLSNCHKVPITPSDGITRLRTQLLGFGSGPTPRNENIIKSSIHIWTSSAQVAKFRNLTITSIKPRRFLNEIPVADKFEAIINIVNWQLFGLCENTISRKISSFLISYSYGSRIFSRRRKIFHEAVTKSFYFHFGGSTSLEPDAGLNGVKIQWLLPHRSIGHE